MAQLIKPQIKWTEEKIALLRSEYPLGDKKSLAQKLGIKRKTLKSAARNFGVKSLLEVRLNHGKKLLLEESEAYYWQGFIMGDGSVASIGRIGVTLSSKDRNHLEKLYFFMEKGSIKEGKSNTAHGPCEYSSYTCSDRNTAENFIKKYKITQPKTFNPPDISCLNTRETFLPFFIGLFDADGCFDIQKSNNRVRSLKIEIHQNWKPTLEIIKEKLFSYFGIESNVKFTSRGYIKLMVCKFKYLKLLKRLTIEYSLPKLERKWDKIDLNYSAQKNKVEDNLEEIVKMLSENKTWKQISEVIGVAPTSVKRRYFQLTNIRTVLN